MLLYNVLMAIVWCWLVGSFSAANVVGGFFLGYAVLWLLSSRDIIAGRNYFRRVPKALSLTAFFLWELLVANIRLAADVLKPKMHLEPAIFGLPLDAKTDAEITMFACLLALTPGTMPIELSADRKTLFIHAMHSEDVDKMIRDLKQGFERRVIEVLR